MSGISRLLIGLLAAAVLSACAKEENVRPDLLAGGVVPEVVIVERKVYVAIPAHLTHEQPIAEGPIAQCFDVAAARRAAIRTGNAQLREIRAIQGTAVKP